MKKWLGRIVLVSLLLLIVLLLGVWIWINQIARSGIEHGATFALGVPTRLDTIDIGVIDGQLALDGLAVSNPEGFQSTHFVKLGHGEMQVAMSSLLQDTVRVPKLELSGLELVLERKDGKANYAQILENLQRLKTTQEPAPTEETSGKRFMINQLIVRDIVVQVEMLPVGGQLTRSTVRIPQIELKDVGSESNQGVLLADVSGIVVRAVLEGAVQSGLKDLGGEVAAELSSGLSSLGDLTAGGVQVVGELGAQLGERSKEITGKLGAQAGEAAGSVGETAGQVLQGVGGLFKKKPAEQKPASE